MTRTVMQLALVACLALTMTTEEVSAQRGGRGNGRQGGPPPPPSPAQLAAPVDLTGQWVSLVTEDWRWRMVTPPKGDVTSIPVNAAGRRGAEAWDPAVDEAAGELCKAYGAPGLLRIPGRLRIEWENAETLRIDTDAGTQTRRLHFVPVGPSAPSLQGMSLASWTFAGGRPPRGGGPSRGGTMKVVTTALKPGYLRKNGVPYGSGTVLTEYFNRVDGLQGESYLVVTTVVADPEHLNQPFITSTHFRKEGDPSRWTPTACSAR